VVARRTLSCLLRQDFFGLTPDYRKYLFSHIHQIIFHGGGGYDFETVYNMPIWLRKFTFHQIKEYKEAESEAINKSTKSNTNTTKINPGEKIPDSVKSLVNKPSYSTKSKK
jgi:hypothetical protein